jgi:uncharacterized membrane protein YeaQ/YmgE (transglycosylase-associated protein family)
MYYLRARYYDPLNGRFNQIDPYAGSPQDPQSLHKYLYAHANPVNGIDPSGEEFSLTGLTISMAIGATIGAITGGVIAHYTQQSVLKGALYGAIIGAILGATIYTVVAFWPQIVQWFKGVLEVWKADRTVSNGLYKELVKKFGENATRAQKIDFFSNYKWYRLVGEGFVGYGQKIWQLLTLNFTGLGTWFTPTLFDGIAGGAVVGTVVLIWIYKDDIKQLFIDLKQPVEPKK